MNRSTVSWFGVFSSDSYHVDCKGLYMLANLPGENIVFWQILLFGAPATQYLPPLRAGFALLVILVFWVKPTWRHPVKSLWRKLRQWSLRFTLSSFISDINDCASNPCQNGGSCTDTVNGYTCSCTSEWVGDRCSSSTTSKANSSKSSEGHNIILNQ